MAKKEENDLKKELKEKLLNELNKEIKKSFNSSINQYKKELKEEIQNDINTEVIEAVKREEKRLLRNKNFSIFKKNIIILCLFLLVCYFGYCLYDIKYFNFMKSDCEKNGTCIEKVVENNNNEKEEEIIKDKDWYIENYGYLLNDANVNLNADMASSYYLYNNDHKIKTIKTSYLLNLAVKKLDEKSIKINSVNVVINASDLRDSFQNLFGTLDNYKDVNFSYDCLNFIYNEEKDRYVAENNKCVSSTKKILENISDMYEEDNKLYILTNATIYDTNENSYYSFDNLYEPIMVDVTEQNIDENAKKLNKYQYIYKKVDDSYYLDSITKLK